MTPQSPTLSPNPCDPCRLWLGLQDEHADGEAECADQMVDGVSGREAGAKSRGRSVLMRGLKLDGASYAARIGVGIDIDNEARG